MTEEEIESRVPPLAGQVYALARIGADYDGSERFIGGPIEEANLITSIVDGLPGMHKPVIDVDMPVYVVPSSTPGHCHLYIDRPMTWVQYVHLLEVLAEVGVIEPGYLAASLDRGHTAVRLPWVRKAEVSV